MKSYLLVLESIFNTLEKSQNVVLEVRLCNGVVNLNKWEANSSYLPITFSDVHADFCFVRGYMNVLNPSPSCQIVWTYSNDQHKLLPYVLGMIITDVIVHAYLYQALEFTQIDIK